MNRYWDMSTEERAKLTEDEVRSYLDVELMEQGVKQIEAPTLRDVEEIDLPTTDFYAVEYEGKYGGSVESGFVFPTADQAHAFIGLHAMELESDYNVGAQYKYVREMVGMVVKPVSLHTERDVMNEKIKLTQREDAKQVNAKAKSAYDEACRAVREATEHLWGDWSECRERAEEIAAVVATFEEYQDNTDNDERALYFLLKIYNEDTIKEALGAERFEAMKVPEEKTLEAPTEAAS